MQNTTADWATRAQQVGISLEEIAFLTGKSYSAVYRYKTGTLRVPADWLAKVEVLIAKARLDRERGAA